MKRIKYFLIGLTVNLVAMTAWSQNSNNMGIGDWAIHIPYAAVSEVHDVGSQLYCATGLAAFGYNSSDGSIERFNKLNYLNDVGVSASAYNKQEGILVLAYENSNIDLIDGSNSVNIPSIKNDGIVADKTIYAIHPDGEDAFLASGFGILKLNLVDREFKYTTFFETSGGTKIKVKSVTTDNTHIFAGTENGVYRIAKTHPNPIDFNAWQHFDSPDGLPRVEADDLVTFQGTVYARTGDSIFGFDGSAWSLHFYQAGKRLLGLKANANALTVCSVNSLDAPTASFNKIYYWESALSLDSISNSLLSFPHEALKDDQGIFWVADLYRGLIKIGSPGELILPNGPNSSSAFRMQFKNERLWVAPGAVNPAWNYQYNKDGFFWYDGFTWGGRNVFSQPALDTILDFVAVAHDTKNDKVAFGSFGGGAVIYDYQSKTLQAFEAANSTLKETPGDSGNHRVPGMAYDPKGNLWMTNFPDKIQLYDKAGNWNQFDPSPSFSGFIQEMLIDENGYIWMNILQTNSQGILVYDPGSNLQSDIDDRYQILKVGQGDPDNGDLGTNDVRCLAEDQEGEIWVGTTEGVSVYFQSASIFDQQDASQIFVTQGDFTNYLLQNEIINDIVVDPANRKWIASNTGVRLVSDDGKEILEHFTVDNSPLISNNVRSIAMNNVNGEVFFATDRGICSYKGEALNGKGLHENVLVFPNPVEADYQGLIAIKGLVQNADVKITDLSGNLVFQTKATGGQAVWNGRDYNGREANSGVYLVFSSNSFGSEALVTRFYKAR